MIVTELILFTFSALVGILMYWRESQNNKLYRTINRITHAENLQMKPSNRKGFLYQQPFLIRLVVIVALFTIVALLLKLVTPIPFSFELLASNIVGALLGTYIASLVVFTNDKIEDGQETIDESIEKGKGFIKDLTKDVKNKAKEIKETIEDKLDMDDEVKIESKKETPKKSGRERLKDKGLL